MYENSVTYQFIANAANTVANGASVSALPEGAVAIVDESHNVITGVAAGAGTPIKVAHRVNGTLKFSPVFTLNNTDSNTRVGFTAPVEQVSFLGYNGTDGAMDTTIDATYTASIRLDNTQGVYNNTPIIKTVPVYLPNDVNLAGTALGQSVHAKRFIDSFNKQFSEARLGGQVIIAERVTDGNRTALASGTGTATGITATKGSTRVSGVIVATGVAGTFQTPVPVGTIVQINGAAFEVVSSDVDGFDLDTPWVDETVSVLFTDTDTGAYDDGAGGIPDNWGVRLTGVTPSNFNPKTDAFPRRISFQLSYVKTFTDPFNLFRKVTEVSTSPVTYAIPAFEGVGTAAEIGKREVYTNMNEQNHIVSHYPPTRYRDSVNMAANYNQHIIAGRHDSFVDVAVGKRPISKFNIVIAVDTALAATWADLAAVL